MNGSIYISIVIPFAGRFELLKESIQSVINQTYHFWECILVNDNPAMELPNDILELVNTDSRIKLMDRDKKKVKGANSARNTGLYHSMYSVVMFLDSDDFLEPFALEKRLELFQHSDADFYAFESSLFNNAPGDNTKVWNVFNKENDDLLRLLRFDAPWQTNGILFKKEFIKKINGWNETLQCWQDWEMSIRSLTYAKKYIKAIGFMPDNSIRMVKVTSISENKKTIEFFKETLKAIKEVEGLFINNEEHTHSLKMFLLCYIFHYRIYEFGIRKNYKLLKNYHIGCLSYLEFWAHYFFWELWRRPKLKRVIPKFLKNYIPENFWKTSLQYRQEVKFYVESY